MLRNKNSDSRVRGDDLAAGLSGFRPNSMVTAEETISEKRLSMEATSLIQAFCLCGYL